MLTPKDWIKIRELFGNNDHVNDKNNPHGVTAEQVGALGFIGAIPAGTDFNTITKVGSYYVSGGNATSCTNMPINSAGHLHVFNGDNSDTGSRVLQIYTRTNTLAGKGNVLFYRAITVADGQYAEWKEIFTADKIKAGSTDISAGVDALATDCIYQVYK